MHQDKTHIPVAINWNVTLVLQWIENNDDDNEDERLPSLNIQLCKFVFLLIRLYLFCYSFYSLWPPDDYIEQLYISLLYMYISLFLFFFTSKHLVSDFAKWPHQKYITLWSLSPFTLSAQILRPSRDKSTDMRILYFSPVKMGACYRTPKQAVVFKGSNGVWSSGRQTNWATLFGRLGDTFWSTGRHESGQLDEAHLNNDSLRPKASTLLGGGRSWGWVGLVPSENM